MNLKTLSSAIALFIGLGLIACSQLNKGSQSEQVTVVPQSAEREFERWNLKEGSIYDGDTLRVVRGDEELKIRFCGIDAPEKKMPMGIEARDHLRARGTSEPLARWVWQW